MKTLCLSMLVVALSAPAMLCAQQPPPAGAATSDTWTKVLTDRSKRGTLQDALQMVRGDTGKWSDEPRLSPVSPLLPPGAKLSLDVRLDQVLEGKSVEAVNGDDQWLLFRTRQLDDNDRVWIERIERQGDKFTIVLNEAIWQGKYFKTFTYYRVYGVNLGKLPPGKYEATWIVKPLTFKQFDGDGRPTVDHWPKDETAAEKKPTELRTTFNVAAAQAPKSDAPKAKVSNDEHSRLESSDIDRLAAVDRTWSVAGGGDTPSFTRHVVPLFNKVGCSNRSCHGSFQGQGGFRLSLFGYDPTLDSEQLRRDDGRGPRIDLARVDESLALRKPLGKVPHGGDQVLEAGSWQHLVLRRWIADGAPYRAATTASLTKLEVYPRELRLATNESATLRTVAHFSDGTREAVTTLTTQSPCEKADLSQARATVESISKVIA